MEFFAAPHGSYVIALLAKIRRKRRRYNVVMTPACTALTEVEYWRDFDIIRNDVNAAMVSCYTHRAINHIAVNDREIAMRMNTAAIVRMLISAEPLRASRIA